MRHIGRCRTSQGTRSCLTQQEKNIQMNLIATRVRSTTGGYIFVGVCPFTRGVATLAGGTYFDQGVLTSDRGYLPSLWVPTLAGGMDKGYLPWMGGTYPGQGVTNLDGVHPPLLETEQHSEYLLCCRWYASCIHAEGLSCFWMFWKQHLIRKISHFCEVALILPSAL